MLNRVILIGRLAQDPELRYTPQGVPVCSFSLAVQRPRGGEGVEREPDFIPIVTWQKLAETCNTYLSKGRLVAVDGRLQIRSYEARDGGRRRAAEVVAQDVRFLDRAAGSQASDPGLPGFGQEASLPEDDLPF
ncbi:MAG TPA: single-stranded DNA-binding protein [Bacillota bacterium]|nr:single-stranded DNA-binding protein [Bacillota bacterium]